MAAGAPEMMAAFIRAGVTVGEARARLDIAGRIRELVVLAEGLPGVTPGLIDEAIAGGWSLDRVRGEIFERMAAADAATHVNTIHNNATTSGRTSA